jgi:hypothetical protein
MRYSPLIPDGVATLEAKGFTGKNVKVTMGGVPSGTPYSFPALARFDGARGTARRTKTRPCDLTFVKF